MPLLSAVITAIDRLDETADCLDSLRDQSLSELEILLMDSGEDASLSAALAERARCDGRLVVVDARGLTLAETRNKALAVAQGKYVCFLSAADRLTSPCALELLALSAENARARVAAAKVERLVGKCVDSPDNIPSNASGWLDSRAPLATGAALPAFVFDRGWLLANGLRFCEWSTGSAPVFLRQAQIKAQRIFAIGRTLVRTGRDSVTERHTDAERTRNLMEALPQVLEFARQQNPPDDFLADFDRLLFGPCLARLRAGTWSRDPAERGWFRSRLQALERDLAAATPPHAPNHKTVTSEILDPLVSVIVPAYNVAPLLPRCLDSLVAQSLASLEVIVVDDGSPDDCGRIADDYAKRFSNVRVVHRENGGLGAARNSGLAVAQGKYVGFVDGDDFVEPTMYAELSQALEKDERAEFAMCGVNVKYAYDAPEKDQQAMIRYFALPGDGGTDLTDDLAARMNVSCCANLYRHDFLRRHQVRFPARVECEDEVFFFQVIAYATRVHFISRPLYNYILNDSGIMAVQSREFKEAHKLPDFLVKNIPLLFAFADRLDRPDLMGIVYRKLSGLSVRYESEEVFRIISRFLHESRFIDNREFLRVGVDFVWCRDRLSVIANYPPSDADFPLVNADLLPPPREPIPAVENPILSYVIPVYNAGASLAVCIDSLRRQTLREIEMIFIDDGSIDRSPDILDAAARRDGRIRVIRQANAGVGVARNRGMDEAKGKYIAFVDADDYLDLCAAEETVALCERHRLDVCLFDFACFNYRTGKRIDLWYNLSRHPEIPRNRVFSPREMSEWNFNAGLWDVVLRRDFLLENNLKFPRLKIGEDGFLLYQILSLSERVYVSPHAYYHYRRGNPSSAVSRLTAGVTTSMAENAQVALVKAYEGLIADGESRLPPKAFTPLLRRIYTDALFYAEKNEAVAALLRGDCRRALRVDAQTPQSLGDGLYRRLQKILAAPEAGHDASETLPRGVPKWTQPDVVSRLQKVEAARSRTVQDLYLVTGQLNSKTNEPIDSWTFFIWLQTHGVPSRYLIWREHYFYKKLVREGKTKDVIALKGDGCADFELLDRHSDLLVRAKALVQENVALNPVLWRWIVNLPNFERVFLQHGVTFWKSTDLLSRCFAQNNSVNVPSVREQKFLEERAVIHPDVGVPARYFIGGLPRYDLLRDERDPKRKEFVLFVMFTWRNTFGEDPKKIATSAYCRRIREFLRTENVARLKKGNVRVVVSLHHQIANRFPDFVLSDEVETVASDRISYWIRHADACLTDYSSVSFDFAFLHKPTIYWIPDAEDVTLNALDRAEIDFAQRQAKEFYNVVDSEESTLRLIETYAQNGFVLEPEKCAIADTFFAHRTDICRHIYDSIEHLPK